MLVVLVHIHVKPECIDDFIAATKENARHSIQEPGIARFDILRQQDDPNRFVLVEVYRDADAPARHKETAHYQAWREQAEILMEEPRFSVKYESVFPEDAGW